MHTIENLHIRDAGLPTLTSGEDLLLKFDCKNCVKGFRLNLNHFFPV